MNNKNNEYTFHDHTIDAIDATFSDDKFKESLANMQQFFIEELNQSSCTNSSASPSLEEYIKLQSEFILNVFNDKRISDDVKEEYMSKYNELNIKVKL